MEFSRNRKSVVYRPQKSVHYYVMDFRVQTYFTAFKFYVLA